MTSPQQKTCFVTIGATASFSSLIRAVLAPEFLQALESQRYTELLVQYGQDGQALFDSCTTTAKTPGRKSAIEVSGFPLDMAGLSAYMARAKGGQQRQQEGVVISHAGSGTVLDALRISVPLIVVPNEDLLDNHQVELAEALAEQEYVVHGKLGSLVEALGDAETLRKKQRAWPPPNSGQHRKAKTGLKSVIDDEMGFLD